MNIQVGGTLTIGCAGLVINSVGGVTGDCNFTCSSFNLVKG